ncbi:MAG: hypothetical protein M0P57_12170 [Syntrophales bacterium]|nr:hypothetical protein [Syntrophales bacterium]MDY0044841.1 hypothetical protein [Syntrophales bacterium]
MSALTWFVFFISCVAVAFHFSQTKDEVFLLYAIPSLALLIIIPLTLSWMSRRSFAQARLEHGPRARSVRIDRIDSNMVGTVLKIKGKVEKISFKWLNRPHFHLKDEGAAIRVVMFTAPAQNIRIGDRVEVLGIVVQHLLTKKKPIVSAVSIAKIEDT